DLERQLKERPTEVAATVERVEIPVEIPVLDDETVEQLSGLVAEIRDVAQAVAPLRAVADQIETAVRGATARPAPVRTPPRPEQRPPNRRETRGYRNPERRASGGGDVDVPLKAGAVRILETFARHYPMRMTKAQLGTLAKFKITGGTFQTYWSILRRAGYVEEASGECWITETGLDRVGH